MKIPKEKALKLIDDKIEHFLKIKNTATFENLFGQEYELAYYGTENLLIELYSRDEANEFKHNAKTMGIIWLGGERDPAKELADYKEHLDRCIAMLRVYRERIENFGGDMVDREMNPGGQDGDESSVNIDRRRVFVVHGRDTKLNDAFFAFLRSINLDPIEWIEAVRLTKKSSPYIGEVLEAAFNNAQAIIVLMTPDDEARLRPDLLRAGDPDYEKTLTPQARPNVLFEAGMAMGRMENRTVLAEIAGLRPFSDIGGKHVILLDNSTVRRQELAERLRTAGCDVRTTGTAWHREGDFSIAEKRTSIRGKTQSDNSKAESLKKQVQLDEISTRILKIVADYYNGVGDLDVASAASIHEQRAIYILVNLMKKGFINSDGNTYRITDFGREYLVTRNLI